MNVIHIASFQGNVGDVINHTSFYYHFRRIMHEEVLVTPIEIRDFYRTGNRRFDFDLLHTINANDLLIIGGGCFFDLRIKESSTGTTLDLSEEFIEKIRVPVIINAIGALVGEECDNQIVEKFSSFIDTVSQMDNWFIRFRNDGSKELLECALNQKLNIPVVPDAGFFFKSRSVHNVMPLNSPEGATVGMCITNDLFSTSYNNIDIDDFNRRIAELIKKLYEEKIRIILFPHAPQDLDTIVKIKSYLGAMEFRNGIIVAPYNPQCIEGAEELRNYYIHCDVVVAMRFHSAILAFGSEIPVIGLAGHREIEDLFKGLKLDNSVVVVGEENYELKLYNKIKGMLSAAKASIPKPDLMKLQDDYEEYLMDLKGFLSTRL